MVPTWSFFNPSYFSQCPEQRVLLDEWPSTLHPTQPIKKAKDTTEFQKFDYDFWTQTTLQRLA